MIVHSLLTTILIFASTAAFAVESDIFKPGYARDSKQSDLFSPTVSFFLPGFGQIYKGQFAYGVGYAAIGLAGIELATSGQDSFGNQDPESRAERSYKSEYGNALYKIAGGTSSYHDFRTAVASRRASGQYSFLDPDKTETPLDLALAPFRVGYFLRPTTYIPLLTLIVAEVTLINADQKWDWNQVNGDEAAVTAGSSYGAGLGEETFFRGFILPAAYEYSGNFWAANIGQAVFFGAAHYSEHNKLPWVQTLVGGYIGWQVRRNDWTLGESIFLHAWYDVIAIGAQYAVQGKIDVIPIQSFSFSY